MADQTAPSRVDVGGGFENCARLRLGNLRVNQTEPASAEAEHGIELMKFMDAFGD